MLVTCTHIHTTSCQQACWHNMRVHCCMYVYLFTWLTRAQSPCLLNCRHWWCLCLVLICTYVLLFLTVLITSGVHGPELHQIHGNFTAFCVAPICLLVSHNLLWYSHPPHMSVRGPSGPTNPQLLTKIAQQFARKYVWLYMQCTLYCCSLTTVCTWEWKLWLETQHILCSILMHNTCTLCRLIDYLVLEGGGTFKKLPCKNLFSVSPVSYTHLTLPTIYSV